jgi:hypothetical protein
MSAADANVFAVRHFTIPDGWGSVDVRSARLEDLFDAWVFAARDAELACDARASSPRNGRAETHAVCRAALDRQERGAAVLAAAVPPALAR